MPMLKATDVASDEQLQHRLQSAIAPALCTVPYPPFEALCAALAYQPAMGGFAALLICWQSCTAQCSCCQQC